MTAQGTPRDRPGPGASGRWLASVGLLISIGWTPVAAAAEEVPMRGCAGCHRQIHAAYLRHGMSRSLGRVEAPPAGRVANPKTGWHYELALEEGHSMLRAIAPDGGVRSQRVVGRIGAGVFDTSWVTAEYDAAGGTLLNRLFFAPVETVTGHGLELSPFEHSEHPSAVDMPLTVDCLTCHTDTPVTALPGASRAGGWVSPGNALGVSAFDHLEPLSCAACHGETQEHVSLMAGLEEGSSPGLEVLSKLSPARQRDLCARCHLQGDVRFELIEGRPSLSKPLASQIPSLVTTQPSDDFRFVGQLERLSLSACFQGAPTMTCTTCHDAHRSVQDQGIASFEVACTSCHSPSTESSCGRPAELSVSAVSGDEARGEAGCVDCHVRRSQPFDLPGIRTTDHFIRRRIPLPAQVPFRSTTEPGAPMRVWDDGRLSKTLAAGAGALWRDGLLAMGLVQTGQFAAAAELFDRFPSPGAVAAIEPTAPAPLVALESWPTFHQLRGMALLGAKRPTEAAAAFSDALRLDPGHPGALMARARMALMAGQAQRAMLDTQQLIEAFPDSEVPWQLRAVLAQRLGRPDFQLAGLEAAVKRWPVDARAWLQLAQLYRLRGEGERAEDAERRVQRLQPSLLKPLEQRQ